MGGREQSELGGFLARGLGLWRGRKRGGRWQATGQRQQPASQRLCSQDLHQCKAQQHLRRSVGQTHTPLQHAWLMSILLRCPVCAYAMLQPASSRLAAHRPVRCDADQSSQAQRGSDVQEHVARSRSWQHRAMKTLRLFVASALAGIAGRYFPVCGSSRDDRSGLSCRLPSASLFCMVADPAGERCGAGLRRIRRHLHRRGAGVAPGSRPSAPTPWDLAGVAEALCGMDIIMFQPAR